MRLWLIKKLIPDYRTERGQKLAYKLWHWTTPHLEQAGYSWHLTKHDPTFPGSSMRVVTSDGNNEYYRGYKQGVTDEIECVETSGEHVDLRKKLNVANATPSRVKK